MFYHIVIISTLARLCLSKEHLAYHVQNSTWKSTFSNSWPGSSPYSQYPAADVVNFGTWFLFSFPISLIMLVVSWFWMHWLFLGCKWVPGPCQQGRGSPVQPRSRHKPWRVPVGGSCWVNTEECPWDGMASQALSVVDGLNTHELCPSLSALQRNVLNSHQLARRTVRFIKSKLKSAPCSFFALEAYSVISINF